MADTGQEKTEQATGKRVSESRAKGNVARSIEINSFVVFTTGTMIIYLMREKLGTSIQEMTIYLFSSLDKMDITVDSLQMMCQRGIVFFLSLIMPVMIGLMIVSLAAGFGQAGFVFSGEALRPKFNKLNPKNIKNIMFSSRSFIEMLKSVAKLSMVGLFAYWVIADAVLNSTEMVRFTISEILSFMVDSAFSFIWKMAIFYAVLAFADFFYQKFKHKKDLMMTKQEVKEENKQMEGDPLIKSKIRGKQMMLARSRMMKDVPKADVVITNPTHVAVALKYDMGARSAPRVVAKGYDEVAQRIKKIAIENNVPLHEDVQLARALYKLCDIGDQIPESLFKAVAQILAFVYQAKQMKKKRYIV